MLQFFCTYISATNILWRVFVKNIGIIKEIDELGRLQIPKDIRTTLGLKKKVQLVVTQDGLLIKSEEYRLVPINNEEEE